jgi:hypothetical protein
MSELTQLLQKLEADMTSIRRLIADRAEPEATEPRGVRLPVSLWDRIEEQAEAVGQNANQFIRTVLTGYFG